MNRDDLIKFCQEKPEEAADLIIKLIQQVSALEERVKKLEEQINKNSGNSDKPPSSDNPFRKKKSNKNRRNLNKRKPGGQKNHNGTTLTPVENPDKIIDYKVHKCVNCNKSLKHENVSGYESKQEIDIPPIKIEIIEYRAEFKKCPRCGTLNKANLPEHLSHKVQYGKNIKSINSYMSQYQLIPYERITEFFQDICNLKISQGTLFNFNKSAYKNLEYFDKKIKEFLNCEPAVHFDETGSSINGKLNWIHAASTMKLTYYAAHNRRGHIGMTDIGILPDFKGIAIHDFWKAYFRFKCCHALCNAHLLRELTEIEEIFGQKWARNMSNLLLEIKSQVDRRKLIDKKLSKYFLNKFEKEYDKILKNGFRINPRAPDKQKQRGRKKQSKAWNLLTRLKIYKNNILTFMYDFNVPFDNNLVERDIRMIKVHQKISGCFRSIEGAEIFCRIRSYISTMKKNSINVFDALREVFEKRQFNFDYIAE